MCLELWTAILCWNADYRAEWKHKPMRVFLSYSRSDHKTVERIKAALNAAGYDTFLDTDKLPMGQEYNARIKRAVDSSDLFVFLASENSVRPNSYAKIELGYAEDKWRNPAGYVQPILIDGFEANDLPAYIHPIGGLEADRNVGARIVGWVEQRAKGLDPDGPDDNSPQGRLARWARLAQPPVGGTQRAFVGRGLIGVVVGAAFIGFGLVWSAMGTDFPGPDMAPVGWLIAAVGLGVVIYSIRIFVQGMLGSSKPVAIVVLDRETSENKVTLKIETLDGKRRSLTPIRSGARNAHTGDLGWAYIRGGLLIQFVSVTARS